MVEQSAVNRSVVGSSPTSGAISNAAAFSTASIPRRAKRKACKPATRKKRNESPAPRTMRRAMRPSTSPLPKPIFSVRTPNRSSELGTLSSMSSVPEERKPPAAATSAQPKASDSTYSCAMRDGTSELRMRSLPIVRNSAMLAMLNRLRTIVSLLLTLVWFAASSHELLERFELIHQVHEDDNAASPGSHDYDTNHPDAADGKATLSSGHVDFPAPNLVANRFLVASSQLDETSSRQVQVCFSGLSPPGTAPPQFSHRWQFSFRTALPPRAPSLIS